MPHLHRVAATVTARRLVALLAVVTAAVAGRPGSAVAQTPPDAGRFTGTIGVYAVAVDPAASTYAALGSLAHNADTPFPLASSFKALILWEVLAAVDEGRLSWKQRIEIPASRWSLDGRLPRRGRVKQLASKMIKRSHNTSTDVLFHEVGLEAPTARLASLGLNGMRVVMPTREFWLALSGLVPSRFPADDLDTAAAEFATSTRTQQSAIVAALASQGASYHPDAIEAATDPFYDFADWSQAQTFAILDDVDNIATPREMVRLYWHLFFDNGLSEDGDRNLRKLMRRGDGAIDRRSIGVRLRAWGGKGGSDLGMGSMAGYGETRDGRHILYAVMGRHMRNEDSDWEILEAALAWIFETL